MKWRASTASNSLVRLTKINWMQKREKQKQNTSHAHDKPEVFSMTLAVRVVELSLQFDSFSPFARSFVSIFNFHRYVSLTFFWFVFCNLKGIGWFRINDFQFPIRRVFNSQRLQNVRTLIELKFELIDWGANSKWVYYFVCCAVITRRFPSHLKFIPNWV